MLVLRHIIFNGFDTRTVWAHTHSISSGFCRWICFSSFVGSFVRLWEHSAIALEYHTWASLDIFFRSMYSDNARRLIPFHFIVFIVSFQSHLHRGTRLEALCLALLCFALAWLTVQFTHSKKRERHSYTKQAIKPASYACTAQHSTVQPHAHAYTIQYSVHHHHCKQYYLAFVRLFYVDSFVRLFGSSAHTQHTESSLSRIYLP